MPEEQFVDPNGYFKPESWITILDCNSLQVILQRKDDDKEKLADAVQKGMVVKIGNTFKPQFVVMTFAQHEQLKNEQNGWISQYRY